MNYSSHRIERERGDPIPVVYDSPHSGSIYPDDFDHVLERAVLRRSEDAHVDELYAHVVDDGAPLLHALFPRCYVDPNRSEFDIDIDMIDGPWDGVATPTSKSTVRGVGLIWRQVKVFGTIYDRKLTADEVRVRIERFWRPYHEALESLLDERVARFGRVYHINCHSMAASGDRTTEDGLRDRPDFVIGDLDGTACEPGLTDLIVETLRGIGHSVAVNDPYKGFELTRRYSDPAKGRHSIQIELNRKLYMDEKNLSKAQGFFAAQGSLRTLSAAIKRYALEKMR